MAFDGSDFKGLDSDVVTSNDGDDEVLDTWLEHRLRGNEYYLLQGRESISWQPWAGSSSLTDYQSGDRPYASLEWSTILCVPWVFEPTLSSIIFDLYHRVGSTGSNAEDYQIKIELRDAEFKLIGGAEETLSNTSASSPTWQTHRIEVDVDRQVRKRQTGFLIVWGRSRVDSIYDSGDRLFEGKYENYWVNADPGLGDVWLTDSGNAPGTNYEHEIALISVEDSGNNPITSVALDVWRTADDPLDASSPPQGAFCYPTPKYVSAVTEFGNYYFERYYISYLQLRSICIEPVHTIGEQGYPSEQIRANIPVKGSAATAHARLARSAIARPKPLWIGPEPRAANSESEGAEWITHSYGERWRWLTASDVSVSAGVLSDATVFLDVDDPHVDVWLWVIGVHLLDRWNLGSLSWLTQTAELDAERLFSEAATASWSLEVEVEQLDNGDASWASATSLGTASTSVRLTHHPDDPLGAWPFLFQQWLLAGRDDASDYDYVYREGQLFEPDMALLRPVRVSVPLSGLDTAARLGRPCRLIVRAQYDGDPVFPLIANPDDNRNSADYLRLVCVGASAWSRKEFSR